MKGTHLILTAVFLIVCTGTVFAGGGDYDYDWDQSYGDIHKGGSQNTWTPGRYNGSNQDYDYSKGNYGQDQYQDDVWYEQDDYRYKKYDLDQYGQNQGWHGNNRGQWRRFKALDEAYHDWRDRMKRYNSRRYRKIREEGERLHKAFHHYDERGSRYYLRVELLDRLERFLQTYGSYRDNSYDLDDCWRRDRNDRGRRKHDDKFCEWPPIPGWNTGGCWDTGRRYSGTTMSHTGYQYTGWNQNQGYHQNQGYYQDQGYSKGRTQRRYTRSRRWEDPRVYRGNRRVTIRYNHGRYYDPNVNGVGDGVYHIFRGSHRDNDGEVMGGVLETFGNILVLGNR